MRKRIAKTAAIALLILGTSLSYGCATAMSKLPPPPQPYVYGAEQEQRPADGSLWVDNTASLFEDKRARRLNDLVTIKIIERTSGTNKTETKSEKKDDRSEKTDNMYGLQDYSALAGNFWGNGQTLSPNYSSSISNKYDVKGTTLQDTNVVGTITARIVKVNPNGTLLLDSRKEVTINDDTQILVLQGVVRPDDIDNSNSVTSYQVADARVYLIGDGFMTESQSKGWLSRFFTKINPF
ncbi:Flagellar L-ring protein [Candidatus Magnetoovum chiemensis]|nr:Flagellar L-ring protein [Candidatus Magnetoovum chiemensis]